MLDDNEANDVVIVLTTTNVFKNKLQNHKKPSQGLFKTNSSDLFTSFTDHEKTKKN